MCNDGVSLPGNQLEALSNLLLWVPRNGTDLLEGPWYFLLSACNVETCCSYSIIGSTLQVFLFMDLLEEDITSILSVYTGKCVCTNVLISTTFLHK